MSSVSEVLPLPRVYRLRTWAWRTGTLLAALIVAAFVVFLARQETPNALASLSHPAQSGARLMERHLAFYEDEAAIPAWQREFFHLLFGDKREIQQQALDAYREILAHFTAHPERAQDWDIRDTRVRLAVLQMETGDLAAAEDTLAALGDMPEEEILADTIRYAYGLPLQAGVSMEEIQAGLRLFPSGWTRNKIRYLVAVRGGIGQLAMTRARLLSQGERLRRDTLLLSATLIGVGLAGLAGFLALLRRATPPWRAAALENAWPSRLVLQVLFIATGCAILIFSALSLLPVPAELAILRHWISLTAALPLLLLIHYRLLRPRGLGWRRAFGLEFAPPQLVSLLFAVALIMTVERLGAFALGWAGYQLGLAPHWAEGISEHWLWPARNGEWLGAVNLVLWAPLIEEIAWRGLLYVALRRHLGFLPAALISAGLFGAVHLYSLAGFLTVSWSGLVWAWAFERYRSLLPGILSHAAGNLLALGLIILFYR